MARLSPGIRFLLQTSWTKFAALAAFTFGLLTWQTYICIPAALIWVLALASAPLLFATRIHLRYRNIRAAANRCGAVLPPKWDGRLLGDFDIMQEMVESLNNGYPGDFAWPRFRKHGPVVQTNILWDMMYITCDPNIIKTILATEFDNYTFSGFMTPVLGTGVFNSDGKFHRSMTRPFFSKDKIGHFDTFDRHADLAISQMSKSFSHGTAVDFQDLVSQFTLDSASEFLFGLCIDSLRQPPRSTVSNTLPRGSTYHPVKAAVSTREFAEAFRAAEHVCSDRAWRGGLWPLFEMLENKNAKHVEIIERFLDPIVEDALRRKDANTCADRPHLEGENEKTLLDHLVHYTLDPVVIRDEVLNILLAGRDTIASTLTFVIYLLSDHPDVLNRLRSEILETVGQRGRPTYEDMKEMKFLRAVINETLRLYPAVPFNMRYAVKEALLPNPDPKGRPLYVPPGTAISYYPFVIHRNTEYWGPDAMEFDPDRFLDERLHKYLVPNPFIFLPFNAGPRICLGQQFAYNEISFFLIKLLQRFDTIALDLASQPPGSLPPPKWMGECGRKGVEKVWPKVHLTLYVNGGLWVKMSNTEG
ncbi:cytochrome P450 [Fomitopsis betulina]|nr:cytochrome P450 [Fomitopsis betulina]